MPILRRLLVPAALIAALLAGQARGQAFGYLDSDCHALKLRSASGVPGGAVRVYDFNGSCNIVTVKPDGPSVLRTVPVVASARWDAAGYRLEETFQVLAPFDEPGFKLGTGVVRSVFKCNDDPIVGGAACGMIEHANGSGFAPFSNPAKKQNRPLLKGKTTLAEASRLSQQAQAAAPPKPVRGTGAPALPFKFGAAEAAEFEAEALVRDGKAQANGGKVSVQPMQAFGAGWSGGEQLFWNAPGPGAVLDLPVQVPAAGRWRIELYLTRAPDYAALLIEVAGHGPGASFEGYAAGVGAGGAFDAGTYQLPAGSRLIGLKVIGKHPSSGGFRVGVDRIRLVPVQP